MGFARDVLKVELWARQEDIAQAVASGEHYRTSVRSAHKVGKTILAACLAWWWVCTRPRAVVILTSAAQKQVKGVLWREITRVWRLAGGEAVLGASVPVDPATGVRFDDGRVMLGLVAADPEGFAGFSSDQIFVCIDEASGFDSDIYRALQGNMAGGGRLLCTGNPTQTQGFFFDSHTEQRHLWNTFHIDARETPNCSGGTPVPGLASPQWVADMVEEYGGGDVAQAELHPVFAVRVMGNFPLSAANAVIPMGELEKATARHANMEPGTERLVIGLDVARFGDDATCFQPLRGLYAYPCQVINGADTVDVAGRALRIARDLARGGERPIIAVDAVGVGGGVVDHLVRSNEVDVVAVDVSRSSTVQSQGGAPVYATLRDEVWHSCREWIEDGGALPPDGKRDAELLAVTFTYDQKLRIKVERKAETKKRLRRSPDRADALCLATWATRQQGHTGPVVHTLPTRRARPYGEQRPGRRMSEAEELALVGHRLRNPKACRRRKRRDNRPFRGGRW